MTETIRCIHPHWITHVPPRSRTPRETLVRTETAVRLRQWEDYHPGAGFYSGPGRLFSAARQILTSRDGFWERLYGTEGHFVLHADIKAYLEGAPLKDSLRNALGFHFAGTPVAAHAGGSAWFEQDDRGAEPGPRGLGEVRADDREASAAALVRYLDENVALIGGSVMMRARPVAASCSTDAHEGQWRLHTRRQPHRPQLLAAGAKQYPAMRSQRPKVEINYFHDIETWMGLSTTRPDPDADLAYMLNAHAGPALAELNRAILNGASEHGDQVALVSLRDALAPVARRARLGLAGTVDLPREAEALCRAVQGASAFPNGRYFYDRVGALEILLQDHVAPRVRAMIEAATPPEDVEAIGGLAL